MFRFMFIICYFINIKRFKDYLIFKIFLISIVYSYFLVIIIDLFGVCGLMIGVMLIILCIYVMLYYSFDIRSIIWIYDNYKGISWLCGLSMYNIYNLCLGCML